jgi:methylated-DNA-[protein]-cysteine S-methyltransferase
MAIFSTVIPSPIGDLQILASEYNVTHLFFSKDMQNMMDKENNIIIEAKNQLLAYFDGSRKIFDLPLAPAGTAFQKQVWNHLQTIPFGKTISYLKMATDMGDALAIRAMASANGKNPIPLIIPCHRVIGNNGKLVGFSGGLDKKQWLLQHEGVLPKELF